MEDKTAQFIIRDDQQREAAQNIANHVSETLGLPITAGEVIPSTHETPIDKSADMMELGAEAVDHTFGVMTGGQSDGVLDNNFIRTLEAKREHDKKGAL